MADPNSVPFSSSASGDTTVLAAPSDPRGIAFIRVLGYEISADGTTDVSIISGEGTYPRRTMDTIQMSAAGSPAVAPDDKDGILNCDAGGALIISQSANGVTVSGRVRYTVIGAG